MLKVFMVLNSYMKVKLKEDKQQEDFYIKLII